MGMGMEGERRGMIEGKLQTCQQLLLFSSSILFCYSNSGSILSIGYKLSANPSSSSSTSIYKKKITTSCRPSLSLLSLSLHLRKNQSLSCFGSIRKPPNPYLNKSFLSFLLPLLHSLTFSFILLGESRLGLANNSSIPNLTLSSSSTTSL